MLQRAACLLGAAVVLFACGTSDSDLVDGYGGGGSGAGNVGDGGSGNNGPGPGSGGGGSDQGGGGNGPTECSTQGLIPPDGPYACGSVGCPNGSVCVESAISVGTPYECVNHFCAAVPQECLSNPTCACLADFLDYQMSDPPTCTEEGGKLKLFGEWVWNPPWTEPPCPGPTCVGDERCWGCFVDGFHGFWESPNYQCAVDNPSIDAIQGCNERPAQL